MTGSASHDRIAELAARALAGQPLFEKRARARDSGNVVQSEYWIARNGYRHLIRLVRVIDGQYVEERRQAPYKNPVWLKKCAEKRGYRLRYLERNRRKERLRSRRVRKERAKKRTG